LYWQARYGVAWNFDISLQLAREDQSRQLDPTGWATRPFKECLIENTLRLFSPLL
jgi:hypothetical protein